METCKNHFVHAIGKEGKCTIMKGEACTDS